MTKKVATYDRTPYLSRRPEPNKKTLQANAIKTCVIVDCGDETFRHNAVKCWDHRGVCAYAGCWESSWGSEISFPLDQYPNGKDFRYCPMHTSRVRNKRDMKAPRNYGKSLTTSREDPIDYTKPIGEWLLNKNGYYYRYCYTVDGRSILQHQHRFVVEQHLGRYLVGGENIHHRNGWTTDNRIENLELFTYRQPAGKRVKDMLDWGSDYLTERGYSITNTYVVLEDNPFKIEKQKYRQEMSAKLGRSMFKEERVVYLDRDRTNLDHDNLELWTIARPESYDDEEILILWLTDFLTKYGYHANRVN